MNTAIPPSPSSASEVAQPGRYPSPALIILLRLLLATLFILALREIGWEQWIDVSRRFTTVEWRSVVVISLLLVLPSIAVIVGVGRRKRWGLQLAVTHDVLFLVIVVVYSCFHPSIVPRDELQCLFHYGADGDTSSSFCVLMLIELCYILKVLWGSRRTYMALAAMVLATAGVGRISYSVGQAWLRSLYQPLLQYSSQHWIRMPANLQLCYTSYITGPVRKYAVALLYTKSRDAAYGTAGIVTFYAQTRGWGGSFLGSSSLPSVTVGFQPDGGRSIGSQKEAMSLLRGVVVDPTDLRFVEALPPAPRRQHPLWVFASAKLHAKFLVHPTGFSVYSDPGTGR